MSELFIPLYVMLARHKGHEASVMKATMDMVGLFGGPVRPPLVNLKPDEIETLRRTTEAWKPWL